MNWAFAAGSIAGVLGLSAIAWLLGLGDAALADEAEAMAIAEAELPGFRAVSAELAAGGQAAVVRGTDGSSARVRRHGAQFVAEPA